MTALATRPAVDKFSAGLYTLPEAARFLGLSESTFRNWVTGYRVVHHDREVVGAPVVTSVPKSRHRSPAIPFVGLAEGYALAAMRRSGVPLQRIRPALERLSDEMGVAHALASRRLYTDGAEVLFDHAQRVGGEGAEAVRELVVVRDGQRVFTQVVSDYLRRIEFGADDLAVCVPLPGFPRARLVADVSRSFGQPIFEHGGARLEDALALFRAGEDMSAVAEEFGMPLSELEDAIRTTLIVK